jgi:hypothetical protein
MPSVKLSPLFNDAQLDNNGLPLSGGLVYWYLAGTSTPVTVYAESTGSTVNTNPVVLTTRGEPTNPIWLPTGVAYKAVLKDSLGNLIRTIDNISGVNDTATPVISEWVLYAGPATYINSTQFSVTGDATATFDNGRRVKATVSGTDRYGTVNGAPVYALGVTTVTLTLDSGVLDSSLATVYYGFLDPAHPSFDTTGVNANTKAGIQSQTWTAFTTGGVSGTYTLTPNPAITAYAAGQKFSVTFNAASSATNTINISGLGAKSLKMYDSTGTKVASSFALNQVSDIVYDGTDFVILNLPQSILNGGTFVGTITGTTINGATMQQGGVAMPRMALSTSQNTTSGTAIVFTGIPTWVKRITVMFNGISTNGSSGIGLQVGSGSLQPLGYLGFNFRYSSSGNSGANLNYGFNLSVASGETASALRNGSFVLTLLNPSTNTWTGAGSISLSNDVYGCTTSGVVAVSGTLDRIGIYTLNGTDIFDAGSVNILYEG